MRHLIGTWLLAGSMLLTGCWTEPEEEVDLRDPWMLDLTIAYDDSSTCTVRGASLHLEGGEPWSTLGTLDGGNVTCTGGRTWPSTYRVAADIWGTSVTIKLREPQQIGWPISLYGEARPERMKGQLWNVSGQTLEGIWFAHQGDCTATEVASRRCWK
jgi:hypothetical protein